MTRHHEPNTRIKQVTQARIKKNLRARKFKLEWAPIETIPVGGVPGLDFDEDWYYSADTIEDQGGHTEDPGDQEDKTDPWPTIDELMKKHGLTTWEEEFELMKKQYEFELRKATHILHELIVTQQGGLDELKTRVHKLSQVQQIVDAMIPRPPTWLD